MLTQPVLLLDEKKCRQNIENMVGKAHNANIRLRPHFKTHQSLEIGRWYRDYGIEQMTVSSLAMAHRFSAEWKDITVAFPANILAIDQINELAARIDLGIVVSSAYTANFMQRVLTHRVGIWIKIDSGYGRTGLVPGADAAEIDVILGLLDATTQRMEFRGFLSHAGHSYNCRSREEIIAVHHLTTHLMKELKGQYLVHYPQLQLSVGDTPTCSVAEDFRDIDEIRPGNFIFYDLMQAQIGSSYASQIAVALRCPVVAVHPRRSEIVIHGGAVHLARDFITTPAGLTHYGRLATQNDDGSWGELIEECYVKSLSQEHGILSVPAEGIELYKPGHVITILPVHSCHTAQAMGSYTLVENGRHLDRIGMGS